ncbi:MAG: putative DNA binding domain-containing protein [Christensenellaceae bacterium]|jgi:ATP-dependent DNA helicase RecG|nr:putative DNA binding domain-containing protein [Christensenellaceae bacterium]
MNLGLETEKTEYKASTGELKESLISMSAMLNKHKSGTVYFGVDNKGNVIGQQIGEATSRDISRMVAQHIKPVPMIVIETLTAADGKAYIKVELCGNEKPYSSYGRYYVRNGDEDKEMSPSQLKNLLYDEISNNSAWEDELTEYTADDIDEKTLQVNYSAGFKVGRISEEYSDKITVLRKFGLIIGGKLTNAGRLLFGNREPVLLKLALFASDEKLTFLDQNHFYGNIFQCIDEGMVFIKRYMRWRAEIKEIRTDIPEVPITALHEIIVNSFAHARYNGALTAHEIDIFPSSIHIFNPRLLPSQVDPIEYAKGKMESVLKNPKIARVLYLTNRFESFGSGFKRTFDLCKENGVEYSYNNTDFGFAFDFKREPINQVANQNSGGALSETVARVYEALKSNGRGTIDEIMSSTGKGRNTVLRAIDTLKELGYIERIGARKDGYWKILKWS